MKTPQKTSDIAIQKNPKNHGNLFKKINIMIENNH